MSHPITPSIRFLRQHNIMFIPHEYPYEEHGGAAFSSEYLHLDGHAVIKTIVLENDQRKGLIVLMHGDKQISTKNLARELGAKQIKPASAELATKWTGFLFGGTSPFGTKTALPVYVEESIMSLETIYINGGKRGFLVEISPQDLMALNPILVHVAIDKHKE